MKKHSINHHPSSIIPSQRGAGLLEMLLTLAMFMAVLPFIYGLVSNRRESIENVRISSQIRIIQAALEEYIFENRQQLLAPISANVTRVSLSDLNSLPPMNLDDARVQLRTIKSRDAGGRSFVQGIVIFDSPNLTPMRTRQIALATGASAGFADGRVLHGAFGTWQMPAHRAEAALGPHSVLAETRTFRSSEDFIHRLPSGSTSDATMRSDLFMGGHDIESVRNITAIGARFLEMADVDTIEAQRMSVRNRLDWTAGLTVIGEAVVNGNMSSDNRNITTGNITTFGLSQFRNIVAVDMEVNNLFLSGFTVARDHGNPSVLSISGALDVSGGYIRATETYVGFSGSITPRLVVQRRIEDNMNPGFFWDAQAGEANMGDMILSQLAPAMRSVFARERTGRTETERMFNNLINNNNATIMDYIRVLEAISHMVENKYNSVVGTR